MTNEPDEPVQPVTPIPPPDPTQDDVAQAQQIIDHSQQEALAKGNLGASVRTFDPNAAATETLKK